MEGLRLDEAMHPLTLLATGLYGETLPNQDGAPIRLVVPWKYGFKSIKSIVKIKLVEKQPPTTWNIAISNEYGFYSNVNPDVDHPRWSQAKERRIWRVPKTAHAACSTDTATRWPPYTAGMDLRRRTTEFHGAARSIRWAKVAVWAAVPRARRLPRLEGGPSGPRRQSDRVHHARHRRLDYSLPRPHARDHAARKLLRCPR